MQKAIPGDAKSLLTHLRLVHHVNHSSTYFQCCETGCGRTFSFIRSFRRHLVKEHVSQSKPTLDDPLEGPAQPVDIPFAEPVQRDEEVVDEWEELGQVDMTNRVALFLAHLRSKSTLTYSNLNFMVQHTTSLIGDIVSKLESSTMSVFRHFGLDQCQEVQELGTEFSLLAEPFEGLDTDYKQKQYFALSGNLIEPVEQAFPRALGTSIVQQRASATGSVRQVPVPDSNHRIPLKQLLPKILEIPGLLQAMLEWQQRKSDALQDLFDEDFCKTHPLLLK